MSYCRICEREHDDLTPVTQVPTFEEQLVTSLLFIADFSIQLGIDPYEPCLGFVKEAFARFGVVVPQQVDNKQAN